MRKRTADTTWKTMFKVVINYTRHPRSKMSMYNSWDLVNLHNDEIVGNYSTQEYAIKQARHKYRKFLKLLEKNFTS